MCIFYKPRFLTEDFRMRIHKILSITCTALSLSVPAWAQSAKYDFDYRTTDQRVQVFDDGRVTRIQLPEGTLEPTIVAIEPKGEVLLKASKEHPHLVVDGIYSRIVMRWGNRREVQAVYGGSSSGTSRPGTAAAFGNVAPQANYGAVGKPVEVVRMVAAPSPQDAIPSRQPQIVAAAVPIQPAQPVGPQLKRYTFQANDKTVEGAFMRWAGESKAGKKVAWRVAGKPPLDALGDFEAEDLVKAMTMVAAAFENSSNPFVIEEYDNVIVVVSKISTRLHSK
jgi:Toxin co-regulated pilus biosynthesis protein Q